MNHDDDDDDDDDDDVFIYHKNDDDIDARTLIDHARIEAQNHRFTFDEVIIHLYHM